MSAEPNMYAPLLGAPAQGVDPVVRSAIGLMALTASITVAVVLYDIGRPDSRTLRPTSEGVGGRE